MAKAVKTIDLLTWSDKVATMSLEQFTKHVKYYATVSNTVTVVPSDTAIKRAYEAAVKKAQASIAEKKVKS